MAIAKGYRGSSSGEEHVLKLTMLVVVADILNTLKNSVLYILSG